MTNFFVDLIDIKFKRELTELFFFVSGQIK